MDKKLTAYEVIMQADLLINHLLENGGELTAEAEQMFNDQEVNTAEVLRRYRYRTVQLELKAQSLKDEAKRLNNAARSILKGVDRMKERALQLLQSHEDLTGDTKLSYDGGCAYLVKGRKLLVQDDDKLIADNNDAAWVKTTTQQKIDRAMLKKVIEDGVEVEGAAVVPNVSVRMT